MSRFIEPLECRTLLSASASTLASDLAAINTDASTVKLSFGTLEITLAGDFKAILGDLKGSGKSNNALLRTLKSDGKKTLNKLKSDGKALLKATSVSKRATADGIKLTQKSSTALTAKVQKDITLLGSATSTPLSNIQADSQNTGLGTDLDALTAANPTNTSLATDDAKAKTDATTQGSAFVSAAQTFATAVTTLQTDLTTLV